MQSLPYATVMSPSSRWRYNCMMRRSILGQLTLHSIYHGVGMLWAVGAGSLVISMKCKWVFSKKNNQPEKMGAVVKGLQYTHILRSN